MKRIILNERAYAEQVVSTACLGDNPYQALHCAARFYFSLGYSDAAVQEHISALTPPGFLCPADRIINEAKKREPLALSSIPVTEPEIKIIKDILGLQRQRVAFALLLAAKYQNCLNKNNNDWANFRHKEIFSMANVKMSVNHQCLLLNDLKSFGLLQFSKRADNLNVRVLYIVPDEKAALEIFDMRNLGYQYMRFCGGSFLACGICGAVVPRKSPRQKFCTGCSRERQAKKIVEGYHAEFSRNA